MMPRLRSNAAAPRPSFAYLLPGPPARAFLSDYGTHTLSKTRSAQKG
jgi:hypothetical protein